MTRKALCVGINHFRNYPSASLQGCVNDVKNFTSMIKDLLGFTREDIITLTDEEATKANIMNNLEMLVEEAEQGKLKYIIFSLSSHGTQVPDKDEDEDDAADEAFCPHDLAQKGNQWDPDFIILDDELNALFKRLPQDVLLEVYLDTCHSGTGVKSIDMLLTRKPRYLPPPSLEAFRELEGRSSRGLTKKLLQITQTNPVHHILWAGCKADQTSADAHIGDSWNGAFTYYFCQVMRECNNRLSRKKVLKKVREYLREGQYTQIPQLECEATVRDMPIE